MSFRRLWNNLDTALAGGIGFLAALSQWGGSQFSIFQVRDFSRALALLDGHPIFFGPESTGGGNLPGPFYYLLLALPLGIGGGWWSVWVWMSLLAGAATAVLWFFLSRRLGNAAAFGGVFSLLASPWFFSLFCGFMNSSFVWLFLALALIAIAVVFLGGSELRKPAWILLWLMIGLGIQLHFTVIVVAICALLLQRFAERLGIPAIPRRWFWVGPASGALLLAPFFLWKASAALGWEFGQPAQPFLGKLSSILPSFLRNFGKLHDGWADSQAGEFGFSMLGRSHSLLWTYYEVVTVPLLAVPLLGSFRLPKATDENSRWERTWRFCLVVAVLPAFAIYPYPIRTRYLLPFFGCFAMVCAGWAQSRQGEGWRLWCLFVLAGLVHLGVAIFFWNPETALLTAILVGAFLLVAILFWRRRNAPLSKGLALAALTITAALQARAQASRNDPEWYVSAPVFRDALDYVERSTGWDYEDVRRRLFLVNVHFELGFDYLYRKPNLREDHPGVRMPDGFFFVRLQGRHIAEGQRLDPRRILLQENLEPVIRRGVESGALRLGDAVSFGGALKVIPYTTVDPAVVPRFFQNLGEGYRSATGASPTLTFNDCPHREEFCRIDVSLRRLGARSLRVEVRGAVLSASSPWISPDWSEGLRNLYLRYRCSTDGPAGQVLLAGHLGYLPGSELSTEMNGTLLAPFVRDIAIPCGSSVGELSVGYESADAYSVNRYMGLEGQEQTLHNF